MSKINTIDERIRKGAREKLSQDIHTAANNLMSLIEIQGTTDVVSVVAFSTKDKRDATDMFAYNRDLIKAIATQATEKLSVKYEDRAVSAFMKKVDSLQSQIDELHNHCE
jgi:ubiquinone biosynthesis protein UbiJ